MTHLNSNTNYDYLPDPLLLVHNSTWRRKPTTVISSKACWSYMNCDHRRCTRSVNTILSFYHASEVHGMYCIIVSCVISIVMHGIYNEFRSSVHLLTCTARTVKSANRASSVHSSICTAYTVICRRSVHNSSSFRTTSTVFDYIVFLGGRELRRTSICCGCSP